MNALITVLIPFRQRHTPLAGDISKMPNAVKLSTLDQHTHIFIWRNLETHREPDHYVLMEDTWEKDLDLRLSKRSLEFFEESRNR